MKQIITCIFISGLLAACSQETADDADSATLYRNSLLAEEVRGHFATFDAKESLDYNLGNCEMASRLLNANISASSATEGTEPHQSVGFWCEEGPFRADGDVPDQFPGEFP